MQFLKCFRKQSNVFVPRNLILKASYIFFNILAWTEIWSFSQITLWKLPVYWEAKSYATVFYFQFPSVQ